MLKCSTGTETLRERRSSMSWLLVKCGRSGLIFATTAERLELAAELRSAGALALPGVPHESQRAGHFSALVRDRADGAHDPALGAVGAANTEFDLFALAGSSPGQTLLQFLLV